MFPMFGDANKLFKLEKVATDNLVFRLHYKLTLAFLVICSMLLVARQFFGVPIHCRGDGVDTETLNTFCLFNGTWTIEDLVEDHMAEHVAHPGLGNFDPEKHKRLYHNYYQWVPLMLIISGAGFYLPRLLWKWLEGGAMASICKDMDTQDFAEKDYINEAAREHIRSSDGNVTFESKERKVKMTPTGEKVNRLLNFYRVFHKRYQLYAFKFFLCEFLNLVQVIVQFFFFNWLFAGAFLSFGSDQFEYWRHSEESVIPFMNRIKESERADSHIDPFQRVFPKMAHCTYRKYGPTGKIQRVEGTCELPLNILNEKIFLLLWLWFIFLMVISALNVILRWIAVSFRYVRISSLRARFHAISDVDLGVICESASISEWFVLKQLSRNVHVYTMENFFLFLAEEYRDENRLKKARQTHTLRGEPIACATRKTSVLNDYNSARIAPSNGYKQAPVALNLVTVE